MKRMGVVVFPFEIQTDSCLSSGWWLPMLSRGLEIRLILKSKGKAIVHLLVILLFSWLLLF